jgi:hypothetical protein
MSPLAVLVGWFVAGAAIFSYSSGIVHTYYLSALAPATSALVGVGAAALCRDARRGGGWIAAPLAAIFFSAWLELALLERSSDDRWLQTVVVFAAVAAGCAIVALGVGPAWADRLRSSIAVGATAVAVAGLLIAPAAWSGTTLQGAVNGVFPGAGPSFISGLSSGTRGFGFGGPAPGRLRRHVHIRRRSSRLRRVARSHLAVRARRDERAGGRPVRHRGREGRVDGRVHGPRDRAHTGVPVVPDPEA